MRTRNSKKPLRMFGRNWKRLWLLPCFARHARKAKMVRPEARLWFQIKICVHLGSQWIHTTAYGRISTELPWGPYCRKVNNSVQLCNLVHNFYHASSHEDTRSKSCSEQKNGRNWRKISARNLTKFRRKKRGDRWSKDEGRKSTFCFTDGHLSFEECRIGDKAPKRQRSNCTPRRHCENDSGYYAVFTEQGSSASQMIAAKVMDIISMLPGCAGQAVDAVSAETQVKMEDAKIIPNSQFGMSRHLDSSTTTQMSKIMVQYGRSSRSSWAQFVR